MQYRPDIDGLRAVAVIPVILFHAGLDHWRGGFVGVDIFFVISGFLITGILLRENEARRFSLLKFYERRARRILPALVVMVLACIPVSLYTMVPWQFKDFSQSVAATSLFSSNILFAFENGYFSGAAEEKPLLHTWSLAVEEQFYILFPLFLFFFWDRGRRWLLVALIAISLASLLAAEIGWRVAPNANFYLLQGRIWELLAGSICAFILLDRERVGSGPRAMLGLILIAVSIVWLDSQTPFPSLYTLLPVVGTCLVILYSAPGTLVHRILSFSPFVGIGLISYSAYLWHQPLFAFSRIHFLHEPSTAMMLWLSLLSLIIAYFSWKYVEAPFRKKPTPLLPSMTGMLTAGALVSVIMLGIGVTGNFVGRDAVRLADYSKLETKVGFDDACLFGANGRAMFDVHSDECSNMVSDSPTVAIWGDSIANSLSYGLREALAEREIEFRQYTHSDCHPLLNIERMDSAQARNCRAFNDAVVDYLLQSDVDLVVLSARWPTLYLNQSPPSAFTHKPPRSTRIRAIGSSGGEQTHDEQMRLALKRTIAQLEQSGLKVLVLGVVPEAGWHVPMKLYRASDAGANLSEIMFTPRETINLYVPQTDAWLRSALQPNTNFIQLSNLLCDPAGCRQLEGEHALYSDELHPSFYLSAQIADALVPEMELMVAHSEMRR